MMRALLVIATALSTACSATHAPARDGGHDAGLSAPPPPTDELDVLFVVQSSNSIGEWTQAPLVAAFPEFFDALASGDHDGDGTVDAHPFRSIHAGVITTDMGTGGFVVPTCARPDFGDDGILRTAGHTDIAGCEASYPATLRFDADGGEDIAAFTTPLGCVTNVGSGGCGFEQPLEAALKALTPSSARAWTPPDCVAIGTAGAPDGLDHPFFRMTSPHGDGANAGFLRESSLLAVVVFADEDDCSASDPEVFDASSPRYDDVGWSLRCDEYEDVAYHPIERYARGLLQLRRHPSRLAFLPLVGVPLDLEPAAGGTIDWEVLTSDDPRVRDVRLQNTRDPALGGGTLIPSCSIPGIAFPPVRILRSARRLDEAGARVAIGSICNDSYESAFASFLAALAQ